MDSLRTNPTPRAIRQPGPSGSAFSLVELLVVITIISVSASIAVPMYAGALTRYRADAAAQRIVADLNYARQRARVTGSNVIVQIKQGTDCVVLWDVPSLDNPNAEWAIDMSAKPYNADILSATFTAGKVTFDGYGYPDAGGSIALVVGTETRTVVLDPDSGKAAVQ